MDSEPDFESDSGPSCWPSTKSTLTCSKNEQGDNGETTKLLATEHLGTDASAYGQQSISTFGSFVLNINNIVGPAVVTLPVLLQRAGWFTPLVLIILMQVVSAFSATMISEAMQRIPGNQHFLRRVEFGNLMQHFWGRKGFISGQIVLNICLQANNIASIVVAAQVLDDFLVYAFGHRYVTMMKALNPVVIVALKFSHPPGFIISHGTYTDDNPFGGEIWIVSLGYIIAMAICIPFGFFNLDQNMYFQWFSFAGMMISFLEFFILYICVGAGVVTEGLPPLSPSSPPALPPISHFIGPPVNATSVPSLIPSVPLNGTDLHWDFTRVPFFGDQLSGQANVIGTIIFMSAFVTTVPSWVNEKKPHVNINKSIWWSTLCSNLLKMAFGYFSAITFANRGHSDNILNVISRHAPSGAFGVITRLSVYLFNFATIIPGIPVFSILVRYNLVNGKLCPPWVANIIGVVAPWIVSMFFYHGKGLSIVVNWSAILLQGFVNFAIPGLLFWTALRWYPNFPDVIMELDPTPAVTGINEDVKMIVHDFADAPENSESIPESIDDFLKAEPIQIDFQSDEEKILLDPEHTSLQVNHTPGWFYANQTMKLRPTNAVPKWFPLRAAWLSIIIAVIMVILTCVALGLDFYFLAKGVDIVDG